MEYWSCFCLDDDNDNDNDIVVCWNEYYLIVSDRNDGQNNKKKCFNKPDLFKGDSLSADI